MQSGLYALLVRSAFPFRSMAAPLLWRGWGLVNSETTRGLSRKDDSEKEGQKARRIQRSLRSLDSSPSYRSPTEHPKELLRNATWCFLRNDLWSILRGILEASSEGSFDDAEEDPAKYTAGFRGEHLV